MYGKGWTSVDEVERVVERRMMMGRGKQMWVETEY